MLHCKIRRTDELVWERCQTDRQCATGHTSTPTGESMSALRGCQDVTGQQGVKWGTSEGSEHRHHQVRRGDTMGGCREGGGETRFLTGAGVLLSCNLSSDSKERSKRAQPGAQGGRRRVTQKEEKGLIPFPVHYQGMLSAGWDVSCSRSSGGHTGICGNTGPLVSMTPNHPLLILSACHSTHEGKEVADRLICMFHNEKYQSRVRRRFWCPDRLDTFDFLSYRVFISTSAAEGRRLVLTPILRFGFLPLLRTMF